MTIQQNQHQWPHSVSEICSTVAMKELLYCSLSFFALFLFRVSLPLSFIVCQSQPMMSAHREDSGYIRLILAVLSWNRLESLIFFENGSTFSVLRGAWTFIFVATSNNTLCFTERWRSRRWSTRYLKTSRETTLPRELMEYHMRSSVDGSFLTLTVSLQIQRCE